jgi:hypothetical protein
VPPASASGSAHGGAHDDHDHGRLQIAQQQPRTGGHREELLGSTDGALAVHVDERAVAGSQVLVGVPLAPAHEAAVAAGDACVGDDDVVALDAAQGDDGAPGLDDGEGAALDFLRFSDAGRTPTERSHSVPQYA